jgi:hypothetical protein
VPFLKYRIEHISIMCCFGTIGHDTVHIIEMCRFCTGIGHGTLPIDYDVRNYNEYMVIFYRLTSMGSFCVFEDFNLQDMSTHFPSSIISILNITTQSKFQ